MSKIRIRSNSEQLVKDAVDTLPFQVLSEREQRILRLRYGLGKSEGYHSYQEIGDLLGLSSDRVRKIHTMSLHRLVLYQSNSARLGMELEKYGPNHKI